MPDRVASAVTQAQDWLLQAQDWLLFLAIGMAIGIGQSLKAREKDMVVISGNAICIGGLAMAAGTVLIWVPELPRLGQIGVAATLATFGTEGLKALLAKFLQGKDPS